MQTTLSELGIVSSRVALLLRAAEIKPVFYGFEGVLHTPPRLLVMFAAYTRLHG